MKRYLILIVAMIGMAVIAVADESVTFEVDSILYTVIDDRSVMVTKCLIQTDPADVTIPEEVENDGCTYKVTIIGDNAFSIHLSKLTLPPSIEMMMENAMGYGRVDAVYISDLSAWCRVKFCSTEGNTSNGPWLRVWSHPQAPMYVNGEKLTHLVIPDDVDTIAPYAFYNCSSIKTISIHDHVKCINMGAFVMPGLEDVYSELQDPTGVIDPDWEEANANLGEYGDYYNVFDRYLSNKATLHVPGGTQALYKRTWEWKRFTNIVEAETLATGIKFEKEEYSVKVGSKITIDPIFTPNYTTNQTVKWTSTDESESILKHMPINSFQPSNNLFKGVALGEVYLTASTTDGSGLSATVKVVVVPQNVTDITLSSNAEDVNVGDSFVLKAAVVPEDATNKGLLWSCSDSSIVNVECAENGECLVTALKAGSAQIIVRPADGGDVAAVCTVTVHNVLAQAITLNLCETTVKVGDALKLISFILPENATFKKVVWTSSDSRIATVDDNGTVRAMSEGNAIITAYTVDGSNLSATCLVNVTRQSANYGDVDGSGLVDVDDVNATINLILNYDTYKDRYPGNADLDGSGLIDVDDVNALINLILN